MVKRLRYISGLVLFAYIFSHFVNHAAGLISVGAMERVLRVVVVLWASGPGNLILYAGLCTHVSLAFWSLYRRRSLKMPPREAAQLILGFLIPIALLLHITGTRIAHLLYGVSPTYTVELTLFWYRSPARGLIQGGLLVIAWIHGCIGLNYAFGQRPWFVRWKTPLSAIALLMPVLALLGYIEAGRSILALATSPDSPLAISNPTAQAQTERLQMIGYLLLGTFVAAIGATLLARGLRSLYLRRLGLVTISYPDGRRIRILRGATVLEASRGAAIPHAAICGGRGRCSTCRVRVVGPDLAIPPPHSDELKVLQRIGSPPMVRLACQLRPTGNIAVTPLLAPGATVRDGFAKPSYLRGSEREIAILFADLRAFTRLAETRLPYDVVFLLNRYFEEMGHAVESAGGRIDKFIGDGVMALFGVESGPERGCQQSLEAARAMAGRLAHLNETLGHDLKEPLRMGIGIHTGPVIVGEMGYGPAISLTAIGDAVNTASRLEVLTKTYQCELVVSQELIDRASIDLGDVPSHEIEIRGRDAPMVIRTLTYARDLPIAGTTLPLPAI
ncbi:MAG TPA: adenylate/guanylate cyclase domain-containing protein [Stellaceae bacterium]|nr:adenylate/guanylate cyclase domain-containing protein [Stellaceae bacterium]